jgi:hypothetical protein
VDALAEEAAPLTPIITLKTEASIAEFLFRATAGSFQNLNFRLKAYSSGN